jgi:5-formyltetrahydrofolate cyclo-ligase
MVARTPKSEARKIVLQRMREISPREVETKSNRIKEFLPNTDDFIHAEKIFAYVSNNPAEVNTRKIITLADGWGKSVFLPKLHKPSKSFRRFQFTSFDELIPNEEGFLEPKIGIEEDNSDIDLMLVPRVAVSMLGQRVGYGGGYYDKMLKNSYAPKYVLAFEFQLFKEIELNKHDIRVDRIITERRIIDTRNKEILSSLIYQRPAS